jgi:formylglycine-generating enzyme required for sulfatase activity
LPAAAVPVATDPVSATASAQPAFSAGTKVAAVACPAGMQHVKTDYCPEMKRQCVHEEYDRPNRITICHRFREGENQCAAPRVPLDYCIDEFEFPNRRGEKPPVMVSFFDAEAACGGVGKRVCRESEWVAACEGPEETPFPTGWRRDPQKCNFDNKWISPILDRVYANQPEIQSAELLRLDRSQASGSRPDCKSGFGVFDLTGNVDEWVRADHEREHRRSRFAGLKGGAWGHVRNACRPVTTSHPPDFKYYFIGFRCCADVTSP